MHSKQSVRWFIGLVLALGLEARALDVKVDQPLPALEPAAFEGSLPDLKGKVVLVDFWASWCGPCKHSFPALEALHKEYAGKGLVILGINLDAKVTDMVRFLEKNPVTFPIVRDKDQTYVVPLGLEALPTNLLVDRAGKVRFIHAGFRGEETVAELKAQIETLLAEGAP